MYEEQGISKFGLIYETRDPKFSSSREPLKFMGRLSPLVPLVHLMLQVDGSPTEGPRIIG
jgi:hypothetical protein